VAWRHGSAPTVAASGAEACTAASQKRYDEEQMSFALSWTTVAMDIAALGGACGFGQKRWVSVGHCSVVAVGAHKTLISCANMSSKCIK
jgi:hypothetical protein